VVVFFVCLFICNHVGDMWRTCISSLHCDQINTATVSYYSIILETKLCSSLMIELYDRKYQVAKLYVPCLQSWV